MKTERILLGIGTLALVIVGLYAFVVFIPKSVAPAHAAPVQVSADAPAVTNQPPPPPPIHVEPPRPVPAPVMHLRDPASLPESRKFMLPANLTQATARIPWLAEKLKNQSPIDRANIDLKLAMLQKSLVCITQQVAEKGEIYLALTLVSQQGQMVARDVEPIMRSSTYPTEAALALTDCVERAFTGYARPSVEGDGTRSSQANLRFTTPLMNDWVVRYLKERDFEFPTKLANPGISPDSPIIPGPPPEVLERLKNGAAD
jgi:hypothetical protein